MLDILQLIVPVMTGIVLGLIVYIWIDLKKLIDKISTRLELETDRQDITDQILTNLHGVAVSTRAIADGRESLPIVDRKRWN